MNWYDVEATRLAALGVRYGRSPRIACAVASALSPRQQWNRAVLATEAALSGAPRPRGQLSRPWDAAQRILRGEPVLDVLRGPKVRAFYRALMGSERATVLDVHMLRYLGAPVKPTPRQYRVAAMRLGREARAAGYASTARYQAAVWVRVRGRS